MRTSAPAAGLAALTGTRNLWPQAWREGGREGVPYTNPRPRRGDWAMMDDCSGGLNDPCHVARRGPGVCARKSNGGARQAAPLSKAFGHRILVRSGY
ncbi:hypothetical protein GQ55_4G030600 [Panicum hallii var. hallii]|uniref:Uncharacterized protein n=1 Tax=Panicum hallii var. hallii TaxID=1504633 RepID=A0A2T7DUP3_9POAL|nr:hypothetical protein GQ55_4G030600 [Panicum hallii var. hallii]